MAITIGSGIQIGGGISFDVGTGGGGGGPTPDITGTLTVAFNGQYEYGYDSTFSPPYGSLTTNPVNIIQALYAADGALSRIIFNDGTYSGANGSIVVASGQLNGSNSVSITIDGVTVAGTVTSFFGTTWITFGSDVFNLISKNTQTLNLSLTIL